MGSERFLPREREKKKEVKETLTSSFKTLTSLGLGAHQRFRKKNYFFFEAFFLAAFLVAFFAAFFVAFFLAAIESPPSGS